MTGEIIYDEAVGPAWEAAYAAYRKARAEGDRFGYGQAWLLINSQYGKFAERPGAEKMQLTQEQQAELERMERGKVKADELALALMSPGDCAMTADGKRWRMNEARELKPDFRSRAQRRRDQAKARKAK